MMCYGMERLRNLDDYEGPPVPARLDGDETLQNVFLLMKANLRETCAPELIDKHLDKLDELAKNFNEPRGWQTLRPSPDLVEYKSLVNNTLDINIETCKHLVQLLRTKPHGYNEGCRILHHRIKDSNGGIWRKCPSSWMYSCINESHEALSNPDDWDCFKTTRDLWKGKGKGKGKNLEGTYGKGKGYDNPWGSYGWWTYTGDQDPHGHHAPHAPQGQAAWGGSSSSSDPTQRGFR